MTNRFKNLLYISNYPPCTFGGAAVIAKQLLHRYEMSRLHVICDETWYRDASGGEKGSSLLPCHHYPVKSRFRWDMRPRRIGVKLRFLIDYSRVGEIEHLGLKLCKERKIEALFAPLYYPEFAIAAYRIHQKTSLPLFVFETDDWTEINRGYPWVGRIVKKHHPLLLKAAERAWLTSPAMVRRTKTRFGVDGQFLFHYVDTLLYPEASQQAHDNHYRVVYTGAINTMFADTMQQVCDWFNRGQTLDGRKLSLHIYTGSQVADYVGPYVYHEGFIDHREIPSTLAQYNAALVAVSFSGDPSIKQMVSTSLYTKTIDYLAARLPIVLISPDDTAQYDYFGGVTVNVLRWDETQLAEMFLKLIRQPDYANQVAETGFEFVSRRHSMEALERDFLCHFRFLSGTATQCDRAIHSNA